jgi:hypothetical protein
MSKPAEVMMLVDRIKPLLAGRGPEIQGAVLADLLATWLAGHIKVGDPEETDAMRGELLAMHIDGVRSLIPINAAEIHRRQH